MMFHDSCEAPWTRWIRSTARCRLIELIVGIAIAPLGMLHVAMGGGPCIPHWDNAIGQPGLTGIGYVDALAIVDLGDGSGPSLYAGGNFSSAGGVPALRIARWDGVDWHALGEGANAAVVTIVEFDDGNGPALYAGGAFDTAGGVAVNYIARWDGATWSALGEGMDHVVRALAVYDDGSGPALYAGGQFTTAGGVAASRIAKWDGTQWSPLGLGIGGFVYALIVYDNGSGPALYAGGALNMAGGMTARGLARWNGSQWADAGLGQNTSIGTLGTFDDGTGPALFVGGPAVFINGEFSHTARLKDGQWLLGSNDSTPNPSPNAFEVFDDGAGPAMYSVGENYFTKDGELEHIARWTGSSWESLGLAVSGEQTPRLNAAAAFDDGNGPALFVGGRFNMAGDLPANRIAAWRGCGDTNTPGDLNGDGLVNVLDLLQLLGQWGLCAGCPADLNNDGVVDILDLLILLGHWS